MGQDSSGVDASLLAELRSGEQVLWWGRPDPKRQVIHKRSRLTPFWAGILLVVLIGFDIFVFSHPYAIDGGIVIAVMLVNAGLLFPAALVSYNFVLRREHLRALRYTLYAITNQRALIVTAQPGKSRGVVSYAKEDIGTISRHEGKEGWGNLIFGMPRPSVVQGRRVMASASFGGIPKVREAELILFQTFKGVGKVVPLAAESEQVIPE